MQRSSSVAGVSVQRAKATADPIARQPRTTYPVLPQRSQLLDGPDPGMGGGDAGEPEGRREQDGRADRAERFPGDAEQGQRQSAEGGQADHPCRRTLAGLVQYDKAETAAPSQRTTARNRLVEPPTAAHSRR